VYAIISIIIVVIIIIITIIIVIIKLKSLLLLRTALAAKVKQSVASVCPSVRPFYLLNQLTFDLEILFVCGS